MAARRAKASRNQMAETNPGDRATGFSGGYAAVIRVCSNMVYVGRLSLNRNPSDSVVGSELAVRVPGGCPPAEVVTVGWV